MNTGIVSPHFFLCISHIMPVIANRDNIPAKIFLTSSQLVVITSPPVYNQETKKLCSHPMAQKEEGIHSNSSNPENKPKPGMTASPETASSCIKKNVTSHFENGSRIDRLTPLSTKPNTRSLFRLVASA